MWWRASGEWHWMAGAHVDRAANSACSFALAYCFQCVSSSVTLHAQLSYSSYPNMKATSSSAKDNKS